MLHRAFVVDCIRFILTSRNTLLPHVCYWYHTRFCRFSSNCFGVRRVPKIWGTLAIRTLRTAWGVVHHLQHDPLRDVNKAGSFKANAKAKAKARDQG